jgi:predicted SAM-dependent methyltransferase
MNNLELEKKLFAAHYVIYTHDFFLEDSIESVYPYVDQILIARTTKPWFGKNQDLAETDNALDRIIKKYGDKIEVYIDSFPDEQTQRNFLLTISKSRGHSGVFIVDCDEVFLEGFFPKVFEFIESNNPQSLRIPYLTFIKDASFCVAPPYESGLFYLALTNEVYFTYARKSNQSETIMPYANPDIVHFSYIREKDEHIWSKVNNFMHLKDTDWELWYKDTYQCFHPYLKNFHPVWPETWSGLELFNVNRFGKNLYSKLLSYKKLFYQQKILSKKELKLHLGCGNKIKEDYVNIDLYSHLADIKLDITDLKYFEKNSVDEIFMNAVFEHIYTFEQMPALQEWLRILKPEGKLIINSTPDFEIAVDAYLKKDKGNLNEFFDISELSRYIFGQYFAEDKLGGIHKDLFTKVKMKELLEKSGFEIESIKNVHWENEPIPCNINIIAKKPAVMEDSILAADNLENSKKVRFKEIFTAKQVGGNVKIDNLLTIVPMLIKQNNLFDAYQLTQEILTYDPFNSEAKNYFKQ